MDAETRQTEMRNGNRLGGRSEGMESITTILRQAREHKGVSLKDVETKTRIPLKYLQALEGGGESGLLADEMYLIPFLRSYSNFLGVDPNLAVTRFLTELQRQDSATVAPPERRPPFVSHRSGPSRLASWIMPFLLLLVTLLLGSYLWQQGLLQNLASWWQSRTREEKLASTPVPAPASLPTTTVAPKTPIAVVPPAPSDGDTPSPTTTSTSPPATQVMPTPVPSAPSPSPSPAAVVPQPEPATVGTPTTQTPTAVAVASPVTPPPVGGHRLSIRAIAPTWMRVVVDSQPGKEMILKAGERREWTAQDGFTVSLGNAGGVALNLDGQELPPAGKSGQVVKNMHLPSSMAAAPGQ